jgi:RecB family exonuclease
LSRASRAAASIDDRRPRERRILTLLSCPTRWELREQAKQVIDAFEQLAEMLSQQLPESSQQDAARDAAVAARALRNAFGRRESVKLPDVTECGRDRALPVGDRT